MKLIFERHKNGVYEIRKYCGTGIDFICRGNTLDEVCEDFKKVIETRFPAIVNMKTYAQKVAEWSAMEGGL